jgi:hypothetical protein
LLNRVGPSSNKSGLQEPKGIAAATRNQTRIIFFGPNSFLNITKPLVVGPRSVQRPFLVVFLTDSGQIFFSNFVRVHFLDKMCIAETKLVSPTAFLHIISNGLDKKS